MFTHSQSNRLLSRRYHRGFAPEVTTSNTQHRLPETHLKRNVHFQSSQHCVIYSRGHLRNVSHGQHALLLCIWAVNDTKCLCPPTYLRSTRSKRPCGPIVISFQSNQRVTIHIQFTSNDELG